MSAHCCPDHCIDDLCVSSDQGLCGRWRCGLFDDERDEDIYGEDVCWECGDVGCGGRCT